MSQRWGTSSRGKRWITTLTSTRWNSSATSTCSSPRKDARCSRWGRRLKCSGWRLSALPPITARGGVGMGGVTFCAPTSEPPRVTGGCLQPALLSHWLALQAAAGMQPCAIPVYRSKELPWQQLWATGTTPVLAQFVLFFFFSSEGSACCKQRGPVRSQRMSVFTPDGWREASGGSGTPPSFENMQPKKKKKKKASCTQRSGPALKRNACRKNTSGMYTAICVLWLSVTADSRMHFHANWRCL